MIKIIKLRLRNLDYKHLKKAGGHIGRNVVEITIKMKTIVRKPMMIKTIKVRVRNFDNLHYTHKKVLIFFASFNNSHALMKVKHRKHSILANISKEKIYPLKIQYIFL